MSNNGKSLTNVSFRAKMLEVIDKLKDQDKTALVRHVDDFEALNKDTFEAGMNALVEAIPEGGGGGGGTGDGGYVVTFGMDFENESITCDKTIEDIIAHANKHIVGRFVVTNFQMQGAPITANLYCDNLKFDYQQLNSDNPEIAPMLPEYTYLGFSGDAFITYFLNGGIPRGNTPLEDNEIQYYKTCISFYYLFGDENPHWDMNISDIGGNDEPTEVSSTNVDLAGNDGWLENYPKDYTKKWNSDHLILQVTDITKTILYPDGTSVTGPFQNAKIYRDGVDVAAELIDAFLPSAESLYYGGGSGITRSALASPNVVFNNGVIDTPFFIKPAQLEIYVDLDTYLMPGRGTKRGVFTVAGITSWPTKSSTGYNYGGGIILYMDEYDTTITSSGSNKLIRHYLKIYRPNNDTNALCDYCQWQIPYTDVWSNS